MMYTVSIINANIHDSCGLNCHSMQQYICYLVYPQYLSHLTYVESHYHLITVAQLHLKSEAASQLTTSVESSNNIKLELLQLHLTNSIFKQWKFFQNNFCAYTFFRTKWKNLNSSKVFFFFVFLYQRVWFLIFFDVKKIKFDFFLIFCFDK